MEIVFLIILNIGVLAGVGYLTYQVYLFREQIDMLETKLFRLRLSKTMTIKHASEQE